MSTPVEPRTSPSKGPRKRPARRKRRLEVDDVLIVQRKSVRTAIVGTVVGNFMEWFDFGVYGYMAIMMAQLFFHTGDPGLDLVLSLLGFAVSFLVRPIGGLVLGPLGDRIGRQRVLFFTMAIMATATALIGVLPTYAQAGAWAAVLLYILKMIQGFSTGGEYAGATTYVSEFSPDRRRGYFSSWLDVGSYLGFAAGAGAVALTHSILNATAGPDAMLEWGWRIPFLLAIPLGAVAIYFRLKIPETPAYSAAQSAGEIEETPTNADDPYARHNLFGVIRHHWRAILIGIALVAATNTAGYALTSYMPSYLGDQLGMNEIGSAVATIPALVVLSLSLPFIGMLSDRIGRRPVYFIAVTATLLLMLPAFMIMQIGEFWAVQIAMFMVAIPVAFYVSISASALPALFPTASRFGAMGIAYNVAVSLFGGTTPFFSQLLIEVTGNTFMPAFWIMFFALMGGIAAFMMKESAKRPLLGSFPTVEHKEDAEELVRTQDGNPDLDLSTMPLQTIVPREDVRG